MKRENFVIIWAVLGGVLLGASVSAQTTMSVEQQRVSRGR